MRKFSQIGQNAYSWVLKILLFIFPFQITMAQDLPNKEIVVSELFFQLPLPKDWEVAYRSKEIYKYYSKNRAESVSILIYPFEKPITSREQSQVMDDYSKIILQKIKLLKSDDEKINEIPKKEQNNSMIMFYFGSQSKMDSKFISMIIVNNQIIATLIYKMTGASADLFKSKSNKILSGMGIKIYKATSTNNTIDSCFQNAQCWRQDKENFTNLVDIFLCNHEKEFASSNDSRSIYTPADQRVALDMSNAAEAFIRDTATIGYHFDYKLVNAYRLDAFVDLFLSHHPSRNERDKMILNMGAYLGELIVRNGFGVWIYDSHWHTAVIRLKVSDPKTPYLRD